MERHDVANTPILDFTYTRLINLQKQLIHLSCQSVTVASKFELCTVEGPPFSWRLAVLSFTLMP